MPEVTRETPSQRLHYRLSVPIHVEVEGKLYKAADWSMGGFRLDGYQGILKKDEIFNPKLLIDFRGFNISFSQASKVVRAPRDGDGMLAVQFEDISEENLELLKYFSEGLLAGEMACFQDAIRRVDMPVTPVDMDLVEEANTVPAHRSTKRMLILLMYLLLGGGILTYIGITLYANFMRIEVEAGVVVAPTEPLVAPVSGIFERLIIPVDRSVKLGEPVIKLMGQGANNGGAGYNALIALNTARYRLETLLAQRNAEHAARGIYGKVGDSRLTSASDRVTAVGQDLALAKNDLKRKRALESQGVISKSELESSQQLVEKLENDLALAKNDLRVAHVAISGLNRSGLFFSGDRIEGRGYGLNGEIEAARKSVAELESGLGNAGRGVGGGNGGPNDGENGGELILRAPFDGHVVRVLKTPGNTVDRGDNLAVLERSDSRYLEVFLTQAESTQVRLGSVAKVFIPSLNIEREARVIQIDRSRGFINETDSRYHWRTTVDRTAVATLFFVKDGRNVEVKDIETGTPCTVNFSRNPSNRLLASLFNFFRSDADKAEEAKAVNQAMSYEYREVVRMQGPTSKRTEAGTQVLVPVSGQQNATRAAVWPDAATSCKDNLSLLWPGHFSTQIKPESLSAPARAQLAAEAEKAVNKAPVPVATLKSAGQTDKNDPDFMASRRAFQDADNAANLALAFRVLGERKYLDRATAILLAWAKTNKPTGHPIDETRLDKMVYAFDLARCDMSEQDRASVLGWFARMRDAKLAWKYGEKSQFNNYRTHQIKMLLLLARALDDHATYDKALAEAQAHLKTNIDATTGETLDHKERNSLHYQAYGLESWLEIALITGQFKEPVLKAYDFLREHIAKSDIHYEFAKSTAPIDEKRARAGFEYAKKGGTFDTQKAVRSLLVYETLNGKEETPAMTGLLGGEVTPVNLFFLIRQQAWHG
ncbi:MAG: alginate lyase family protein [Proteobacteria bacterium]|nr:alginate lyase family protein [Pseudomonadota bacterium]